MTDGPRFRFCLAMVALLTVFPAPAEERAVTDANLVTAIDVSGSIKMADERLEIDGMAQALIDPRFVQAIQRGMHGRIGFAAFSWANGEFIPLVPWTLIGSKADAQQVAERLRAARGAPLAGYAMRDPGTVRPWRTGHATDVSAAIEHAIEVAAAAPFMGRHQVVNLCANGIDNIGESPAAARDHAMAQDLIINGLVLGGREDSEEIAAWFREHVQAGPGSFVIEARAFEDIANAMLAKFVIELAEVPAASATRGPKNSS